ncbi:hypothetical protein FRC03_011537 [Tulasnella sp. 419]|nr:hypothetical protein FRC02_005043 [Tulasnella sp. 418]KAG8954306.1 hypothetical protein FRC03_011537 [Tulasnella sp. 419]
MWLVCGHRDSKCRLRRFTRNLDGIRIHTSRTMKQNNGLGMRYPSSTSAVGVSPLSSSLIPATGTRCEAMTVGQRTSKEALSNPTPARHRRNNKFEEGATSLDDSSSVPPPREIRIYSISVRNPNFLNTGLENACPKDKT